jgi:hypothetical protein
MNLSLNKSKYKSNFKHQPEFKLNFESSPSSPLSFIVASKFIKIMILDLKREQNKQQKNLAFKFGSSIYIHTFK